LGFVGRSARRGAPGCAAAAGPSTAPCALRSALCALRSALRSALLCSALRTAPDAPYVAQGDRPLLVQFCANEPATLLAAAKLVEGRCDGVDLNLGCPRVCPRYGCRGTFVH
jgi:tRNA-dihydrouridine synthase 1